MPVPNTRAIERLMAAILAGDHNCRIRRGSFSRIFLVHRIPDAHVI